MFTQERSNTSYQMMTSRSVSIELHSAKRLSLADSIREQLAQLILKGEVAPGERLPSEHELCRQLNVGRTSLREAIRALQALGFVEVRHGKGTFVRPKTHEFVPYSAWPDYFDVTITDILELRLAIEPSAAALAASRRDRPGLEAIADSLSMMESGLRGQDLGAVVLADLAFHQRIVEASKNVLFRSVMERTADLRIESLRTSLSRPGRPQRVLVFHRKIFDAIQAADSDKAAEAIRAHILNWAGEMQLR